MGLVFVAAAVRFPAGIGKILLVGCGWFFFSRSMAEKSVTLVSVISESGEAQKISWGRRSATQLGMLTFSVGVLTQQWQIAVIGIVFSMLTAAAMWQNFRARLPYLYDPWSEELPPPPTLMHAMIAISLMVEFAALVMALLLWIFGPEHVALSRAMSYAICSVAVSLLTANFLSNHGVRLRDVWLWNPPPQDEEEDHAGPPIPLDRRIVSWISSLGLGAAGGLLLGAFGQGYMAVLRLLPGTSEMIEKARQLQVQKPEAHAAYFVMAVFLAPFAEEYLFRGLLFKALDREWGGWRAVAASAAFFAIYHPPLSWLPVALLGATNALIFKRSGRLAPAVVVHMVYNAIVLWQ